MAKKISFFVAAVLAALILGIACENPDKNNGGGGDFYTVTFMRNNDDPASGPDEIKVQVPAGEKIGSRMPDSQLFAVNKGDVDPWEAGYMVTEWYTLPNADDDGGRFITANTVINNDLTVYAQWGYGESPYFENGNLIVIAPSLVPGGDMHDEYDGYHNTNLSITWKKGAIRWAYPAESSDYDYVEIEYIGKGATTTATTIPYNILKQYDTSNDYTPETGTGLISGVYPTFTLPAGKMKFKVIEGGGGIAIQVNTYAGNPLTNERTMKFVKATFTKETTRYTVTFDPNYSGATAIPNKEVPKGFKIGTLPYLARQNNQDFVGWVLASDGTTSVDENYVVTSNLALKAKWETFTAGTTFTVDFNDAATALSAGGTNTTVTAITDDGDSGYRFTYGTGDYNNSWAYFTITLAANVRLSAYKEVTIKYRSVSGDTSYKPFALLAAAPTLGTLPTNPHNGSLKINSPDCQGTTHEDWTPLTFTIDKAKAAGLTNTIQVCIYDHSAATGNGAPTVWEIKDVTFVQD